MRSQGFPVQRKLSAAVTTAPAAYLPPELVEEILLNLPVKSLLRFTSVSKSWNSMIRGSGFIKRYHNHAMIVLKPNRSGGIPRDSLISPLSSNTPLRDATPLVFPFKGEPYLHASCDELWCVELAHSLFLWNPSTRTYGKLPDPSLSPWPPRYWNQFSYGLGYDSTADDYKMMKIHRNGEAELYSLKLNSWRNIKPFTRGEVLEWNFSRVIMYFDSSIQTYEYEGFREYRLKMGVFLGGALHWIVFPATDLRTLDEAVLISFDLSTEKYGEVGLPQFDRYHVNYRFTVEMTALKGMLCLCVNYCSIRFVLWVMEDYVWTRKLDIDFQSYPCLGHRPMLRPFYLYDNGEFLIHVCDYMVFVGNFLGLKVGEERQNSKIFVCNRDEETMQVEKDFDGKRIIDSFVYVENLVSLTKLGKKKPLRFVDMISSLGFVWGSWLQDLLW